MATISAYTALNMVDPSVWYGEVIKATSTQIAISDGYETAVYYGHGFAYSGDYVVGGTLTGYQEYSGDVLIGEASGLSFSAAVASAYINANDLPGLFPLILSGPDQITGGLSGDKLAGYGGDDILDGRTGNDAIYGGSGHDIIRGGAGTNYIDGGTGFDFAVYDNDRSNYDVQDMNGTITVYALDGTVYDTVTNTERLGFHDGTLAFDFSGNAGEGYRLYQAALDRTPDTGGLSYWVDILDQGHSLHTVANEFIKSKEFHSLYGNDPTNADLVDLLYENVLHREPDQGGYDYWLGRMDDGVSQADMLIAFSESDENQANVWPAVHDGIWMV
jgi:hypothetical protein